MSEDSDAQYRYPLEELASLPSFYHPTVSPDGAEVALCYDGSGRNELHVLDAGTGEHRQVSDGQVPRNARWFVRWDGAGEGIYFHLDDAGDEQNDVHRLDRDGTSEPVVELDGQTVLADVADDWLLVASSGGGQMNLYRHDLGGGTTKLTDYERAVRGGEIAPGGDRIAYATNEADDFDNQDVYVADADGSTPRNLGIGEIGAEASVADWAPDGERLLVGDNTEDLTRCGVYDLSDDSVTWVGGLEHEEQPVAFLDDDRFVALRTRRAAVMPVVYDLATGEGEEFDLPEGVATVPSHGSPVLGDGRVLVSHTTPTRRQDLLAYDLETGETETLLAAEYGDIDPDQFADAEYFRFDSHDGLSVGALFYDSGRRPSPLVVNPHGGPRAADYRSFDQYTQFLVSRGYSVLQVNYRGSTGRGREYVRMLHDDWGGDEQADVATGARRALERYGFLDSDRVAVFGGSYGGYSAYMQLLQYPELYAAGIAWIGVTDLRDMYENTMPHFRTELMEKYLGTPGENPGLYDERSPVTHVEKLSAPLFVIHGVNDRRVPVSQARIFREALEEAGYEEGEDGDFEYRELGEEGHASSDIDQKIRAFRLMADFLERRMPAAATAERGAGD